MSKDYKDNRKKEQAQQAYIYLVQFLACLDVVALDTVQLTELGYGSPVTLGNL